MESSDLDISRRTNHDLLPERSLDATTPVLPVRTVDTQGEGEELLDSNPPLTIALGVQVGGATLQTELMTVVTAVTVFRTVAEA
jgi:hypothetical protein